MTDDTAPSAIDETRTFACDRRRARRRRPRIVLLRTGVLLVLVVAAATGVSLASANASVSTVKQTCMQVSAVLSDGPDPDADPVGYAQAQILPLRQIHTHDIKLMRAIDQLASAYQTFVHDNGKGKPAHSAVNAASKKVDAICPGSTS